MNYPLTDEQFSKFLKSNIVEYTYNPYKYSGRGHFSPSAQCMTVTREFSHYIQDNGAPPFKFTLRLGNKILIGCYITHHPLPREIYDAQLDTFKNEFSDSCEITIVFDMVKNINK